MFAHLQAALPDLERLLERAAYDYEDGVYRFYHQSFKVYQLQELTAKIVASLQALSPERPLNDWFAAIVNEGTGKRWDLGHNEHWLEITRPILEAFVHAKYMLEMAVRFGKELKEPPTLLPSGWAALLSLFNLR